MTGTCTAVVSDEKGQYERNICKNLVAYVDPHGNGATAIFDGDSQASIKLRAGSGLLLASHCLPLKLSN